MKRITEWGFNKKIRRAEKEQMLRIERNRSAVGKRTTFRIRGQEVTAAKLRRAALVADDHALSPAPEPDALSCISYETLTSGALAESEKDEDVDADGDASEPGDAPVYTDAWAEHPAQHFWRLMNSGRTESKPPSMFLPFAFERDVVSEYRTPHPDVIKDVLLVEGDTEATEFDAGEIEPVYDTSFPEPFNLRKFLTSTMLSLNHEFHQEATTERLEVDPFAAGLPTTSDVLTPNNLSIDESNNDIIGHMNLATSASSDGGAFGDSFEQQLTLFRTYSPDGRGDDRAGLEHFSSILGILKSRYDHETATLNLMGMVFGDGDLETEDSARDKLEALLEQRTRLYGFEHQDTLDACLVGVIFLLDATRLDAEQNTWKQPQIHPRLLRVRTLMRRIFAAHLQEETVQELLGDDEGLDFPTPKGRPGETRQKAERMMADIIEQAVRSHTVLHALELLPRYHMQWAGYRFHKRQETMRERPSFCTR